MELKFCSKLALSEGEPIDGTAPEKDSAIFLPAQKKIWHRNSGKDTLQRFSKTTDLVKFISKFNNPLICFYNPNEHTKDHIFVADSSAIVCFTNSGYHIEREVKWLYAICTDGKKDVCCAKFGIPIAQAFLKVCKRDQFSVTFETSHIGGCRFAATAVCFPSGNSYGRIHLESVSRIKKAEECKSIDTNIFRGNIFVSEIHCWIIRYSIANFGFFPMPSQTTIIKENNLFHITIAPDHRPEIKFDLFHHKNDFQFYSGCAGITMSHDCDFPICLCGKRD